MQNSKNPCDEQPPDEIPAHKLHTLRTSLGKYKAWLWADRFGTYVGLPKTVEERNEHIEAIKGCLADDDAWRLHAWMHQNLTILDDKTNAILWMDAIALATLTTFYSTLTRNSFAFVKIGFICAFLLLAWSLVPLGRVAFVYWSTTEEFRTPQEMFVRLLEVRDRRSRIVRGSTMKGILAFFIFAIILITEAISKLL